MSEQVFEYHPFPTTCSECAHRAGCDRTSDEKNERNMDPTTAIDKNDLQSPEEGSTMQSIALVDIVLDRARWLERECFASKPAR